MLVTITIMNVLKAINHQKNAHIKCTMSVLSLASKTQREELRAGMEDSSSNTKHLFRVIIAIISMKAHYIHNKTRSSSNFNC